jgi:DNA-3-methyladenine glycosylase I
MPDRRKRCGWCGTDPLYVRYHDEEWGVPVHDDRRHFEFLTLEGAQAGLSWITILRKRERYRERLAGFDPERVARMGRREVEALLRDPGIVRNRLKVEGAVRNARAFLSLREEAGGFDRWVWQFVDGRPVQGRWRTHAEVPATTPAAEALSRELKRKGFTFVGPTIAYAYMQAVGLVNDHLDGCFRRRALAPRRARQAGS